MVMEQVPGQAPSDFPIYNESGFLADAPVDQIESTASLDQLNNGRWIEAFSNAEPA